MRYDRDIAEIEKRIAAEYSPQIRDDKLHPRGDDIRVLRGRMTQQTLAAESGVPQTTISRMETEAKERGQTRRYESAAFYAIASELGCKLPDVAVLPDEHFVQLSRQQLLESQKSMQRIVFVRTLFCPDVECDLRTFYYRTIVDEVFEITDLERTPLPNSFELNSLNKIDTGITLIQGIAGQGKSICLRFLGATVAESLSQLVVFIELRQANTQPLLEIISQRITGSGFPQDERKIEEVLHSGQVVLLLDAFDEVHTERRRDVLDDISFLNDRHPKLRIVVTSRPQAIFIGASKRFRIKPLEVKDLPAVIACYATPDETLIIQERIATGVGRNIVGMLTSPLMVLLLVIHFRYTNSVPSGTTRFYKDLLDVLLQRHNVSASGLKREITSGLDTHELRQFFGALCFVVQRDGTDADILNSDLEDAAAKAMRLGRLSANPRHSLDDIIYISNLIIQEGGWCRFIHKSVKEYYAASFVSALPESVAERFYAITIKRWRRWEGVLTYLSHIDSYRYLKYFALADINAIGAINPVSILRQFEGLHLSGRNIVPKAQLFGPQRWCLNSEPFREHSFTIRKPRLGEFVDRNSFKTVQTHLTKTHSCTIYAKRRNSGDESDAAPFSTAIYGWDERSLLRVFSDALDAAARLLRTRVKEVQSALDDMEDFADDFME